MKELYALVPLNSKGQLRMRSIICMSKTREELDAEIQKAYWGTRACMAKGSIFEVEDYMRDKVKIKINYEVLS